LASSRLILLLGGLFFAADTFSVRTTLIPLIFLKCNEGHLCNAVVYIVPKNILCTHVKAKTNHVGIRLEYLIDQKLLLRNIISSTFYFFTSLLCQSRAK